MVLRSDLFYSGVSIPQAGCQPDGGGRRSISSSPLNNETRQEHYDGISVGFRLALLLAIPVCSTKLMREFLSFLVQSRGVVRCFTCLNGVERDDELAFRAHVRI